MQSPSTARWWRGRSECQRVSSQGASIQAKARGATDFIIKTMRKGSVTGNIERPVNGRCSQ
jgi:hypothetical protein